MIAEKLEITPAAQATIDDTNWTAEQLMDALAWGREQAMAELAPRTVVAFQVVQQFRDKDSGELHPSSLYLYAERLREHDDAWDVEVMTVDEADQRETHAARLGKDACPFDELARLNANPECN